MVRFATGGIIGEIHILFDIAPLGRFVERERRKSKKGYEEKLLVVDGWKNNEVAAAACTRALFRDGSLRRRNSSMIATAF